MICYVKVHFLFLLRPYKKERLEQDNSSYGEQIKNMEAKSLSLAEALKFLYVRLHMICYVKVHFLFLLRPYKKERLEQDNSSYGEQIKNMEAKSLSLAEALKFLYVRLQNKTCPAD